MRDKGVEGETGVLRERLRCWEFDKSAGRGTEVLGRTGFLGRVGVMDA